jgi:hypothetical protein
MKHITKTQLNEYLDGALEAPAQASLEAHLSDCTDCQARLASLQAVFKALAALPEVTPKFDLTSSVLKVLPDSLSGLIGRLAFAIQAGVSLGVLLIFAPIVPGRIAGVLQRLTHVITRPEIKWPSPIEVSSYLPVIRLPHPPELTLPYAITYSNFPVWLILGIAAVLLFMVGNFSLVFHSTSEDPK